MCVPLPRCRAGLFHFQESPNGQGQFLGMSCACACQRGGYVDHPKDPGGATNLGITLAALQAWRGKPVTKANVRALTPDEAAAIYRANDWNKVKCDDLPAGLDLVAFDVAVNSGFYRGSKWLQDAVGASTDGDIGPRTPRPRKSHQRP